MKKETSIELDEYHELLKFDKNIKINCFKSKINSEEHEIDSYFSMTQMSDHVKTIETQ